MKTQIEKPRSEFKNLESSLAGRETIAASKTNGGVDGEIVKSLEFFSSEYDDLIAFQNDAKRQLQLLNERLSNLVKQVDEIAEDIDAIERYSYQ